MYEEFETKTSYRYLKEVIGSLSEPICMLGGWAVFFHVNGRFQKTQGRPYLGSRDIDLGFDMRHGGLPLTEAIKALEKLNFRPVSFRMVKEIHTETEEEIKGGEKVPSHFVFPMSVDLIVDSIPDDFRKRFGFSPIDEPLLRAVFDRKDYAIAREFGRKLLLPKPEVLMAMKVVSLPERDSGHKRIKDLCDLFALAWYTGTDINGINLGKYVPKSRLGKCAGTLAEEDYGKAASQLGHDTRDVKRVLSVVCRK